MQIVYPGRRGYGIVEGHDLTRAPGEVVVERGIAREWDLHPGDRLSLGRRWGELTVAGVAVSPDNVAYPLARTARVYVGDQEVRSGSASSPTTPTSPCCGSTTAARRTSR